MRSAWVTYLLFLAEAVTVVLLIAGLIALTGRLIRRGRPRGHLQVENLGHHYDELTRSLEVQVLPKRVVKQHLKADRTRRKEAAAGTSPARSRVFVIDFRGDLRASQVAGLREEITAILGVAQPGDEVVLRLNNPGGAVHEQGLAASQLLRVRNRGLGLTVCVDSMAASGGYMMACVANRIVAAPFAILGSIGVISVTPNFHRLLDRAGVDVEQFTGGQFKRTVSVFGQNTESGRAKQAEEINETHDLFKEFVAQHRPGVDIARVATGETWFGTKALDVGLVDELGTSDDYLLLARERADLYRVSHSDPIPAARRMLTGVRSLLGRAGFRQLAAVLRP